MNITYSLGPSVRAASLKPKDIISYEDELFLVTTSKTMSTVMCVSIHTGILLGMLLESYVTKLNATLTVHGQDEKLMECQS